MSNENKIMIWLKEKEYPITINESKDFKTTKDIINFSESLMANNNSNEIITLTTSENDFLTLRSSDIKAICVQCKTKLVEIDIPDTKLPEIKPDNIELPKPKVNTETKNDNAKHASPILMDPIVTDIPNLQTKKKIDVDFKSIGTKEKHPAYTPLLPPKRVPINEGIISKNSNNDMGIPIKVAPDDLIFIED